MALLAASVMAITPGVMAPARAIAAQRFANIPYAAWTDDEPQYRLYPGDEPADVAVRLGARTEQDCGGAA